MKSIKLFLSFLLFSTFLHSLSFANNNCFEYKITPSVSVGIPDWSMAVVQPLEKMNFLHGNVIATLSEDYEITAYKKQVNDGYCIGLRAADSVIGYSDFMVQIDLRHAPGTCTYNATLEHEDEHIRTYLSVIDDYNKYITDSIITAANSVMPVFISNEDELDFALNKLNNDLQSHPDLILMKQKIKAEEEIRNKDVDHRDPGIRIKKCLNK